MRGELPGEVVKSSGGSPWCSRKRCSAILWAMVRSRRRSQFQWSTQVVCAAGVVEEVPPPSASRPEPVGEGGGPWPKVWMPEVCISKWA